MPGLIRRTLLIGGVAAAAGGLALWRWRMPGDAELDYGTDPSQVLDIRYPSGGNAAPVLVIFHDGDFATGDKSDTAVWPEWLEAGIAVVRVNTRLSDRAKWPAQADDALAAVVHLQRNGADLGLNPAHMVLMGQGAGAYLAVTTALSLVEVGLSPKGVVSLYGPMDFSTLDADLKTLGRAPSRGPADDAASPESRLLGFPVGEKRAAAHAVSPLARLDRMREPLPPILIRHGDADTMVADLQAKRLREAWIAADPKAAIDYKLVPGAGHGGQAFETDPVRADVLAFVQARLA
ncbi:alpha/beta hydrolase [Tabrizicola sp.]|uniref:alpha/beta hydrolase n=1 Tax=Tabrizicola sp. TaxID=2005166 RepID=UPI002FDD5E1D